MRPKALAAVVAVGILGIGAFAFAAPPKKKEDIEPSESEVSEDETIEVEVPSTEETPGASIEIDSNEILPVEEIISDVVEPTDFPDNPVDEELAEAAIEQGITDSEAIAEVVDTVTDGLDVPPLAAEETSPDLDPYGTVALARLMLAREAMRDWKHDLQEEVKEWQSQPGIGLEADGKFGIVSAGKMAEEVGILPLIRFYPSNTYTRQQAIDRYKTAAKDWISFAEQSLPDSEAQILALRASISREKAQSFGASNPSEQPVIQFIDKVNKEVAKFGEKLAEGDA